jgi:hypothetical protein
MKRLNIFIIVIMSGMSASLIGIVFMQNMSESKSSSLDYDMQQINSICQNPQINGDGENVTVTCPHPTNYTNEQNALPLPTYKRTICSSTYGCSGHYIYMPQIPSDLLTESQKQQVIDQVLNFTDLKQKYPTIRVGAFQIKSHADQWFAEINFLIPNCNWYPSSTVNLNTMQIVSSDQMQTQDPCKNTYKK